MADYVVPDEGKFEKDPVYRHCVVEARFILGLWLCCFLYTVGYCYLFGYLTHEPAFRDNSTGPPIGSWVSLESFNRDPDSLTYPLDLGIPDWIFYGVAMPWVACIMLSFWYAFFLFSDDDLSDPSEHEELYEAKLASKEVGQ